MNPLSERAKKVFAQLRRLPSLDETHQELLVWVDGTPGAEIAYLGTAADGSPMMAFGAPGERDDPVLLLLAGSGESVAGPALTSFLLRHAEELAPGWRLWAIPALEPARLRLNEPSLGMLTPSVEQLVATWRPAYGPGEETESSLPIDSEQLWQPDQVPEEGAPEMFVPTPPEAVALARALTHLKPAAVVSLRETLVGGATVALSQELADVNAYQGLLSAVTDSGLVVNAGAKLRPGRQLHGVDGVVVLASLEEERQRLGSGSSARWTGGVSTPQFLQTVHDEFLYVSVDLPRLTAPAFADLEQSRVTRCVHVGVQDREKGGRPVRHRIITLEAPHHPADGAEVRVEPLKRDEEVIEGRFDDMQAAGGWLAVEACMARRAALDAAYELMRTAAPVCQHTDHLRGMQLLRETDSLAKLQKSFSANKRYARSATRAEETFWSQAFAVMTAAMLHEARHTLRREDQSNSLIADTLGGLDTLIAEQLQHVRSLRAVGLPVLAQAAIQSVNAVAAQAQSSGPAQVRAQTRVDLQRRILAAARRAAREARNLKLPKAERQPLEAAADVEQQRLAELEDALAALQDPPRVSRSQTEEGRIGEDQASDGDDRPPRRRESRPDRRIRKGETNHAERRSAPSEPLDRAVDDRSKSPQSSTNPEPDGKLPDPVSEVADQPLSAASSSDDPTAAAATPPPSEQPTASEGPPPSPAAAQPHEPSEAAALRNGGGEEVRTAPQASASSDRDELEEFDDELDDSNPEWVGSDLTALVARPSKHELIEDFEDRIPPVIGVDPEWGHGAINWEAQLPDPLGAPPLRRQAKQAAASPAAQGSRLVAVPEPHPAPERVHDAQPADSSVVELGELAHTPVGFRRRRVELPRALGTRPLPAAAPTPKPTGGQFRPRKRTLA